jgi:hypothetical protein
MALIKNKLSAVEMSAESQIERASRCDRMMSAKQMSACRLDRLSAGAIDGAVGSQEPRRVFQPAPAAQHHRGTNLVYADPPIMVSSHGAERSDARQSSNQRLQRLQATCPIHQISPKQDKVRTFPRCDLQQFVNNVARSILSQMKITRKQETLPRADIRDTFTAYEQRPSRTNLDVIE